MRVLKDRRKDKQVRALKGQDKRRVSVFKGQEKRRVSVLKGQEKEKRMC